MGAWLSLRKRRGASCQGRAARAPLLPCSEHLLQGQRGASAVGPGQRPSGPSHSATRVPSLARACVFLRLFLVTLCLLNAAWPDPCRNVGVGVCETSSGPFLSPVPRHPLLGYIHLSERLSFVCFSVWMGAFLISMRTQRKRAGVGNLRLPTLPRASTHVKNN